MEVAAMSAQQPTTSEAYQAVQSSEEFQTLRKKFRGFVFPVTAFFLVWYFLYVLLSIFAQDFMNRFLFGKITIGLVFGFLQFFTTFAITFIYARWANRELDPLADAIGSRLDGVKEH